MTDNAVLQLRAERLARATRPFLARGNRIRRCQRCLLPLKVCLCETLAPSTAQSRFCLVMFDTEPMKPSNTGRLIADILPDTAAFQWSRTEPPQALLDLGKPGLSADGRFPGLICRCRSSGAFGAAIR
jgi:DTW domain-containing protein YfiP